MSTIANEFIVTPRPDDFHGKEFATLEDCITDISRNTVLGVDLETESLSFALGAIRTLQIATPSNLYFIDIEGGIPINAFKKPLEQAELIMQDGQFDLCFLYDNNIIPSRIWDTKLAEHALSLGITTWKRDYGTLVESYLGITIDKSLQAKAATMPITNPAFVEYAFADVRHLFALRDLMTISLEKWGVKSAHSLHNRFARVLAYIEYSGIRYDKDRLKRWYRKVEAKEWFLEDKLNKWLLENTDIHPYEFNWGSSAQVGSLLKTKGYDIYDKKKKKDSVDIKLLKRNYSQDAFIQLYIEYCAAAKDVSTYGRNWEDYPCPDGLVHTKFKALGAATGRTSCGDVRNGPFPNLQNTTGEKDIDEASQDALKSNFRDIFTPRNKRFTFINIDYSQQEAVIMADKSQEPTMLAFFKNDGNDFHSFIAQQVWHEELGGLSLQDIATNHKGKRKLAKQLGFTLNYGGGAWAFADNAKINIDDAQEIIRKYFAKFSKLANYYAKVTTDALTKGYVLINDTTNAKRFIEQFKYYKMAKYGNRNVATFEERVRKMALNTPIQGTAADIAKTAGILIFDWIVANKRFGKTWIPLFVHDEYVIEDTKERAEETAAVCASLMVKAGKHFLKTLDLKATPVIGDSWGH